MNINNISILGSTGSIGKQTLEVIRNLKNIKVKCLSTNKNIDLLIKQIEEFEPEVVTVMDKNAAKILKSKIKNKNIDIKTGLEGLIYISTYKSINLLVNAVVGNIGLIPTIKAIENNKNIALANKEVLVTAGELITKLIHKNNVSIYPIDSEHSAIFQCLEGNKNNDIKKIILTASGGPFRKKTYDELKNITLEDALKHPNWKMGPKITIDSSTMMNKGLEVIEAKWLFNLKPSQIDVVIHPQSIIHSMVQFEDNSIIAQLSAPDMRIPIQYALTYPKRLKNNFKNLDLLSFNHLTFESSKKDIFKCLKLSFDALEIGGTMPAVLNSVNEILVNKFLNKKIKFLDIQNIIEKALISHKVKYDYSIEDILNIENWGKKFVEEVI